MAEGLSGEEGESGSKTVIEVALDGKKEL